MDITIKLYEIKSKYIFLVEFPSKSKTKIFKLINKFSNESIGVIKYFPNWRQYCFYPKDNTLWNSDCIKTVNTYLEMLNNDRKEVIKNASIC